MIQRYALTKPCRLNWNTTNCGKNGLHPLDFIETSNGLHPSDVNETSNGLHLSDVNETSNGLHPSYVNETSNGLHPSDVNETLDCQINTKPLRRKYLAH